MNKNKKLGIVILAAGMSSRFGSPKQLAIYKNKTLIKHIQDNILSCNLPSFIVLGAHFDELKPLINEKISIIKNNNYANGIGSSISMAVDKLYEFEALLFVLADQPLINTNDYKKLINFYTEKRSNITATLYKDNSIGVPAIFNRVCFDDLLSLKKDHGAKKIIYSKKFSLNYIQNEKSSLDIDTQEDLEKINKII